MDMNSVDMANNLIFRAKNLNEFIVETDVPETFKFTGMVPFDMTIGDGRLTAKVWAVTFEEAAKKLDNYLSSCSE